MTNAAGASAHRVACAHELDGALARGIVQVTPAARQLLLDQIVPHAHDASSLRTLAESRLAGRGALVALAVPTDVTATVRALRTALPSIADALAAARYGAVWVTAVEAWQLEAVIPGRPADGGAGGEVVRCVGNLVARWASAATEALLCAAVDADDWAARLAWLHAASPDMTVRMLALEAWPLGLAVPAAALRPLLTGTPAERRAALRLAPRCAATTVRR